VAQGKVSAADARKFAEKITADSKQEFEQASDQLSTKLKELFARTDEKTQQRIAALEARVDALEIKPAGSTRSRKS
jgi:polyhydroxyalkanoate synthesis regulator phasin